MKKLFLFLAILSIFHSSARADLTEKQRIDDATQLVNLFHHLYGPMSWKEQLFEFDRNELANDFLEAAANAQDDLAFYQAIAEYLTSFKDIHVSWSIPSTKKVSIGFTTAYIGNEVVIVAINRQFLPKEQFPFEVGDQVTRFDDRLISFALEELIKYAPTGHKKTERQYAAFALTYRTQSHYPYLPSGAVQIEIYSQKQKRLIPVVLEWQESGFELANFTERKALKINSPALANSSADAFPALDQLFNDHISEEARILYQNLPYFPLWTNFVQRTKTPLLSGTFRADGKRIGFIRIPTWSGYSYKGGAQGVIKFFEKEIPFLQANTDALVIDQTNNPGGNLCLGSDVVSFFLKEPTVLPLFIVKPTRNRVNTYEREYTAYEYQYNNSKEKTRADRKKLAALRRFIGELHSALAEGKEFTHPFHLCNPLDRYNPYTNKEGNNIHYSKPVLILTDETSCSMGDYFPAAMQDAGVAKLFGHRTAGCGGNVLGFSRLGYSDIGIRITESLMVRQRPGALLRLEDQVIENVGVQPDFPYDPSAQDFRNGYPQYRKAIVEAVLELIE